MELTADMRSELLSMVNDSNVPANVATRARIVLWFADGLQKKDVAERAGVSLPTVYLWLSRYESDGIDGLVDRQRGAPREQVPARIRGRVLALTRTTPPAETGLTHWSSREMARYVTRTTGTSISWHYVAKLWRDNGLKPHRQGTFKLSRDPAFAEKVADIVGLYLAPPEAVVVLCVDEKTQVQALDRTQPLLPITFDASEKRTHDYVRHGTTNLFAALNTDTGEVFGECRPSKDGENFLAFL
ncbi:IS630 family transposase, partial [Pseudofrankia sp. BMG5.37]|uniref:IS630 family transposase n=1 Tax=Pseudofrankia sp. BMG5.37 TaxID=3050035 RepID=UPI0028949D14|nr:IS630 family transposase [Pseudofrankia sp. BMG5.37]